MSKILEREIGSITFAAGQTRTLQLPRNYAYRQLCLRLVANLTRATTAGTDVNEPCDVAPSQLVQNLQIVANGRDVIKSYDLETLHRLNCLRHGVRPHISSAGWAAGADAAAVACVVSAFVDFAMPKAIRPIDTLLDSAGLSTLDLIVNFGNGIDTMDSTWQARAGAAVTVNSCTLYVSAIEEVGIDAGTQFMVNKEYKIRKEVSATNSSMQIQLPVGNLFRSFTLKSVSNGVPVNTVINNIKLKSGSEVYKNRIAPMLQMDNRLHNQTEVASIAALAAAQDHYLLENLLAGYYHLEFCPDGRLTQCLDTSRLSSLELELDVTYPAGTTTFIDVYPVELIRPPDNKK